MLYRLTWAECPLYLRSDDRRLVAQVADYLDLAAAEVEDDRAVTPAADVAKTGDGHRVRLPYGETNKDLRSDTLFLTLEAIAYGFAMAERRLVVHAGGFVAGGEGAVICFGAPFSGKSSLTYAAWRRGFGVLGDDRICLDPDTAYAAVYPKCLKLRLAGGPPPAEAADALALGEAFVGTLGGDRRLVLSRRLAGFVAYDAAPPIRAFVCIERSNGRESRLDRIPVVDAIDGILSQAMLARHSPMALVRAIKAHARRGRLPRLRIAAGAFETGLDLLRDV